MPASGSTAAADGRTQRSSATRQKILDATRALLIAGTVEPSATDIAAGAGIATRTLFRHFPDLESLHRDLVAQAHRRIMAVMDEPLHATPCSDWRDLLHQVIDRRVRVYEHLLPLYVSSTRLRSASAFDSAAERTAIERRRQRLRDILPAGLAEDETLFEALDATLSIDFWLSLRKGQNLGVERATRVLQRAVQSLASAHQ